MLLGVYLMSLLLLIGWGLSLALFYMGVPIGSGILIVLAISTYNTFGNFATFFEVASSTRLDGTTNRVRILPFLALGFLVSLVTVAWATVKQIITSPFNNTLRWHKTQRFRNGNGNGHGNGHVIVEPRNGLALNILLINGRTVPEHIFDTTVSK
jgi:hypothetical protein